MSSYFSLPSFARAKKNQEELRKSNPQNPVLNEKDQEFLSKQIETAKLPPEPQEVPPTKITESGEEKEASKEEKEKVGVDATQFALPEEQPQSGDGTQESKQDDAADESVDDPPEQVPEDSSEKVEATAAQAKKPKKNKSFALPSQEEAEAATKGFNVESNKGEKTEGQQGGDKRTWASYLPSYGKKDQSTQEKSAEAQQEAPKQDQDQDKDKTQAQDDAQKRTWAEAASAAYSAIPSLPSWRKDKDSQAEPEYNEDGSINEEKTKEKQEREVSVLLDKLDMSSINNRVFAFSGETQKFYERFAQVLKDTMNGGPTAYEDMEKLMKDAGPTLEKQFESMPPFVQTLVKSLPSKLGTTLGPELMAAASEKPGAVAKKMEAASKSGGDPSISTSGTDGKGGEDGQKKKRKIPGLKSLVSSEGAVASALRNVVNFLSVRFPFLASTTNVVMSLSVFILMFVFWYCHKRGKEARLAKEAAAGNEGVADEGTDVEIEVSDSDEAEGEAQEGKEPESVAGQEDSAEAISEKAEGAKDDVLNQQEPSQVPLPDKEKGEKGAELEAQKSVGA